MKTRDLPALLFAFVCSLVLVTFGLVVYYEIKHPCVRWEDQQHLCGGDFYCALFITDAAGNVNCAAYDTHPTFPCTVSVCVERKS